jgi:hypothetical protein
MCSDNHKDTIVGNQYLGSTELYNLFVSTGSIPYGTVQHRYSTGSISTIHTSTMSIEGYGVSDYFLHVPLVLKLLQIFLSLAINAVAFGLLILCLSTSQKQRRKL